MDYLSAIEEIIKFKDAPLGVPNEIPLAIMSKELKKDVTVVLSGEGADELLGGYGRIFRAPFEYSNIQQSKEDFYNYFIKKYEYVPRRIRDLVIKTNKARREEYDTSIKQSFSGKDNEYNIFKFFHKYHVKGLLQRVDSTSMLASVEARVPFLDHELIEYSYKNIPYNLKLHWNSADAMHKCIGKSGKEISEIYDTPKYILREIAKKYLPSELITRKKVGFPVPLNMWDDNLIPLVKEELNDVNWLNNGDVDTLIQLCNEQSNGNQLLWMFLNVQLFIKNYFSKEWRY